MVQERALSELEPHGTYIIFDSQLELGHIQSWNNYYMLVFLPQQQLNGAKTSVDQGHKMFKTAMIKRIGGKKTSIIWFFKKVHFLAPKVR